MNKRTLLQIGIIGIIGISFISSVLPVSATIEGTIIWEQGTQWEFSMHDTSAITESDAHGRSDVLKFAKKANYHAQLRSQPTFGSSYSISVDFYGEDIHSWSWAPGLMVVWEDIGKSAYILKSSGSYARWWMTDGSFQQVRGTMQQDRWYTLKITVTYFGWGTGLSLDIQDKSSGVWDNLASHNYWMEYLDADPKVYIGTSRTSDYPYSPGSDEIYYFADIQPSGNFPQITPTRINGTLRHKETKNILRDAYIELYTTGGTHLDSKTTDVNGEFEFEFYINEQTNTEIRTQFENAVYDVGSVDPELTYDDIEADISYDYLPWGVDLIDAEKVWGGYDHATDVIPGRCAGQGVKVAILDTGIATNQPDLIANYRYGYDFVDMDFDPWDRGHYMDYRNVGPIMYHGTAVAGILAATDNGLGVIGVAPEAEIYAVRITPRIISRLPLDEFINEKIDLIRYGIQWAIDSDMDIVSMSLGFTEPEWDLANSATKNALYEICRDAAWEGLVLVASTGNSNEHWIEPPARFAPYVIAVGAVVNENYDPLDHNYGPEMDFVGPLGEITTRPSGWITDFGGTSSSTPHISGIIALMLCENPDLTLIDIVQILRHPDVRTDLGDSGWDEIFGYGFVNAHEAWYKASIW